MIANLKQIHSFLSTTYEIIWGWPLILAILAIGVYFTYYLELLKLSRLKLLLKSILDTENCAGDISVFASLCTALSATIGTGNIVGIAVAITLGGPGALFWLWLSSIFSFAIKYCEGLLAIKYRKTGTDGKISGGPMYYIEMGLQNKKFAKVLANVFAFSGMITALVSTGTLAQSNSISVALSSFGISINIAAITITTLVTIIILGGIHRIAAVSKRIVPIMTILYIGTAIIILVINYTLIPHVFTLIFQGAFSPESILGGGVGLTFGYVASIGVSRGIYCHESGLGSSAIAEATGKTNSPVRQGLTSMSGAVLSVITCTMTGLVLIITCNETLIFTSSRILQGLQLTSYAFGTGLGVVEFGEYIVKISIVLFAFTTIIGWNYYGEKCAQYVFGDRVIIPYKLLYIFFVAVGPFWNIETIFIVADILTGFMAISNLVGVVGLRKDIIEETQRFFEK